MSLQRLLEDNRYLWQQNTQKEIMRKMLFQSSKVLIGAKKEEKLVVVFGKPQVGKTTVILTLMGIMESRHHEISRLLRAGISEGNSSTSTAIIYQRSADNKFRIGEWGYNETNEGDVQEYDENGFVERLKSIRENVENGRRDVDKVLYLFIPDEYFETGSEEYANINILDVPGYGSRNERERCHVEAVLNKYMAASTLNIIVREIHDINDLRDFTAPNGDRLDRMLHKYIIITTHSYSMENIAKYFDENPDDRKCSFDEYLMKECNAELKRIFGNKIPKFYALDVGQSFWMLLDEKIQRSEDRDYLREYRNKILASIRECIQQRKGDTLSSWIKELVERISFWEKDKLRDVEDELREIDSLIAEKDRQYQHKSKMEKAAAVLCDEAQKKIKNLQETKDMVILWINNRKLQNEWSMRVAEIIQSKVTPQFKWKEKSNLNNVSMLLAELLDQIRKEYIEGLEQCDGVMKQFLATGENPCLTNEDEMEVYEEWNKQMYPHKVLKALNPSIQQKFEMGRQNGEELLGEWEKQVKTEVNDYFVSKEDALNDEYKIKYYLVRRLESEVAFIGREKKELELKRNGLLEEKEEIHTRVDQDKKLLANYRMIAQEKFRKSREMIIDRINTEKQAECKVEWVILLSMISGDYEKLEISNG